MSFCTRAPLRGNRAGNTVYVAARRPLECEHAAGPSFGLSPKDAEQLERLLLASKSDPELAGMELVGWYVSHTRRPFGLSSGDIEIFDRFFPDPQKVTGVVQPAATGKARFGWFIRNADGVVDAQRPSSEFTIYPTPGSTSPSSTSPGSLPSSVVASLPENAEAPLALETTGNGRRIRGRREESETGIQKAPYDTFRNTLQLARPRAKQIRLSNRALIGAALLAVIFAAAVLVLLQWPRGTPVHTSLIHVFDTGTQLRIDWDPKIPVLEQARLGVLEIREPFGEPVRISLSRDMLQSGSVFLDRPSSKVEVHLRLTDAAGSTSESMVYFIGRDPEVKKPVAESVASTVEPTVEPAGIPLVEKSPPPPSDKGSAERARSTSSARPFKPPVAAKNVSAPEPALVEPPKIPMPQSQPGVTSNPLVGSVRVEAPVAAPPSAVEKPPPTPATSGRLIWTGVLPKGSVLHVTDLGPSTGSLNGSLPARPVKVSIHSAELLDGVIAVYIPDANSMRTAEAPGRRNGWNVTMYKFDPKHTHDLSLVESPAVDNNFRLGIKSNNRQVSMIVIDWRATD